MKKIGFVIPWYGDKIPGGAEADLRGLAKQMVKRGVEAEILTTCVKEFSADWGTDYYKPGTYEEGGLKVKRFPVRKRNKAAFDTVNYKLLNGQKRLSGEDEKIYINEMVNSPDLYQYIREHKDEYSVFAFIPYMFGTTYFGMQECPEKAVMIPCFHDESYAYLRCFGRVFPKAAGMAFHAAPERRLAEKLYDLKNVKLLNAGSGMDVDLTFDKERFQKKYEIKDPFILYAGRKDAGKNVDMLLTYFWEYKKRHKNGKFSNLKLVLLGGGNITVPAGIKKDILDLGFVPVQDKYDACGAAAFLCQPSRTESFSLVIMESWLCGRPVLVFEDCAVTKNFVQESNGGLYFKNYPEFEKTTDYLLEHEEISKQMGINGRDYVKENFAWDTVVRKYLDFFREIAGEDGNGM